LTLSRGILLVDTADVAKNNIILSQCGKIQNPKSLLYVFRSLSLPPLFSLPLSQSPALSVFRLLSVSRSLSLPLSHSPTLAVSSSGALYLTLILCTLALYTFALSTLVVSFRGGLGRSLHSRCLVQRRFRSLSALRSLSAFFVWAKGSIFISFLFEKRVNVALLSDCSCKRMFFFVEWFACKVLAFIRFLIEKEVFLVVSLFSSGSEKVFAFRVWFLLVLK